ncbi:hypothetical protein A3F37_00015 [Candidatus Saccharibacteria bacterium RIFCSPHIGHO2_12_FULL_41_12]|nr:MAG: hypothetical protein A3F37_00015 [Candidatus Saccharibacteria bacterium RIFCSPHIGHO2_12_FULL_41_12]
MLSRKSVFKILTLLNVLVLLLNIVLFLPNLSAQDKNQKTANEVVQFPYLSKRILNENQNNQIINFTPLRQTVREYLAKNPNQEIGIYFEYLPSGTSIGVNDQMEVKLASLIKVPTVMATYKAVEDGNLDLNQELTISQNDIDSSYGDLWKKGSGFKITTQQAIELALTKSDNTANKVLGHNLKQGAIGQVFDHLDIPKNKEGQFFVISPKGYTSILRSLYLSSYLKKENSNQVLDILSKTAFTDKLQAGAPSNVKVSHKIGVYDLNDGSSPIYSDCGIVYVPYRPYSLCIVTKNMNEETARKHIQTLSKMVYGYVSQVN